MHSTFRDDNGNLLIIDLTICNQLLTLVNLYGPNTDTPIFYMLILQRLKLVNNTSHILGGDWNLVLNPSFNICRGCRQGDPLSPYICILCVEILGEN